MLSMVELERIAAVLTERVVGARVERWVEPEKGRLAASLYLGSGLGGEAGGQAGSDSPRNLVIAFDPGGTQVFGGIALTPGQLHQVGL